MTNEKIESLVKEAMTDTRTLDEIVIEALLDPDPEIAEFFRKRDSTPEMRALLKRCRQRGL